MKITQDTVRELVHYDPRRGTLKWKPRDRKWFKTDVDFKRWNRRYANQPAFTYVSKGYRWGSVFNKNQLAHRIVWMHVHGEWPQSIKFRDGDGTNIRLSNLADTPQPRVRLRLAA